MLDLYIKDETSRLKAVVLGTAVSFGGTPTIENAYDPKSKEHIRKGTFPKEIDLIEEMTAFEQVLKKYGVDVIRPENIENLNQVYSRDIGFVIDNKFVVSNVLINRSHEIEGIEAVLEQIEPSQILRAPEGARMEGGDVMPWHGKIFIGYSEEEDFNKYQVSRTNLAGVQFLKENFPNYEVHAFELKKSDIDPKGNALHLDCCFQPIGKNQAIIYKGGFKNESDYHYLLSFFGKGNIIEIDKDQMYNMYSNIFSISDQVIVSDKSFKSLNEELRERGFTVEEIQYTETSKMEGLLRCSTLPLIRE